MTDDDSTPITPGLNQVPAAAHDLHCLDFTRKIPVPVVFAIHPDTHSVLVDAANVAKVSLPDFLVDSAWEKARELRQVR